MAYIERTLTINSRDLQGAPLDGRVTASPVGIRQSAPVLLGGGTREWVITDGALEPDAVIIAGQKYEFALYEPNAVRAWDSWSATVPAVSGPISINELYRQKRGSVPTPSLLPLYSGDPVDRLAPPDGATDMQVLGVLDGQIVAMDAGDSGSVPPHASSHAAGGSDPITSVSIGAASASALAAEATARQTADTALIGMVASKASAEDLASEITAREEADDELLGMIESIGTPVPASPLPYWASTRGPNSYVLWVGDSLGIGASVPIYPTDGWVPLVATGLQNAFSPGRHPTGRVPVFMSAPFLPDEVSHFDDYVDVDPGIIAMGAYMTGPGTASLRTQTPGARYRRFHARFTTLGVEHVITNTDNYNKGGESEVWVDGQLLGTLNGSIDPATGAPSLRYAAIVTIVAEGLPDVEHAVVIKHVSTAPNYFSRWFGLRCYDPQGVNVDSYSRHDARTEWYGNTLPAEVITDPEYGGYGQPARMISGLDLEHYKSDGTPWTFPGYNLLVYAVGINNVIAAGHTLEAMRLDVLRFLRGMYAPSSANRNASLIMILPGQDETYPSAGVPRADAVALYREVVEQVVPPHCGAAFIDMQPRPVGYDWPGHFDAELHAAAGSPHILDASHYANRVLEVATA